MNSKPLFYIRLSVLIIISGILIFYFFYQARFFILGPRIVVEFPQNGDVLKESLIEVKGKAQNVSLLLLNGKSILVDTSGNFKGSLILAEGYNIIELLAKDKFDREVHKKLKVILK